MQLDRGLYFKMDIKSLDTFLIMWGIPAFMVAREYFKMNKEERKSAMRDFKTPGFIFTIGFLVTGAFLATLGNTFTVNIIKMVGIVLVIIGGIVSTVDKWKRNKMGSMFIFMMVTVAIFLLS